MKRLQKQDRNAGAIALEFDPEDKEKFNNNLFKALRKFGSGKKTRATHKLIDKNMIHPAIFSGDATDAIIASTLKDTKLYQLIPNIYHFDDSISGNGTVKLANELMNLEKKIKKEETFVNEARLHKIEKLQETRQEETEKLLKSFDYIKMVDGIYFGWLNVLANTAVLHDNGGKAKIVTTAADILSSILKKLYQQVNQKIDPEVHKLIEAIAIYFINMYFYGMSSTYTLNSLKKAFDEDTIEAIQRTKINKIDDFNDLSKLMKETELLPITPNTFDMQMERMFGKLGYSEYVKPSLISFLAYMANMAHPNQLFKDTVPIDQDLHERLEELLLNEQKKITFKEH
jgi:hypothetical protein